MVISLVADYLAQVVPPSEPDGPAMIRDMRDAVDRANRVISEMLEFARPSPLSLQPADFQNVAESALSFLKLELTRKHISVRLDWCREAPLLQLDRHKMAQVLVNVFLNAIQAMPEGGTLSIATRSTALEFTAVIDDTGRGIPVASESSLFQPFFTTKPPGQGTGLGLSVARQIVKLHGGTLDLANRPGGGARVTLRLLPTLNQTSP
jgi:signal transduction histidine kinase